MGNFRGTFQSVTGSNSTSSDRLSTAQERLVRAIGRLEIASKNRSKSNGSGGVLNDQVQQLKAENAELRSAMDSTAQRLDTTIAKFKTQLAG